MGQLVFQAALGGAVNLIGPNISATTNFTLPGADGTNGQALTTNGSGVLGFSSIVSGAAGSNTQVQFNNGGNFGASSNLTWNGTTFSTTGLSASGSVTLSGGTANGVTYLNGSKVLTSGSALVFDGTNLGIGVTPTVKLDILNTNATYSLSQKIFNASAGTFFLGQAPSATFLSVDNFAMAFCTNSNGGVAGTSVPTNERMRITSAGDVGIGTSSPAYKLDVLRSGSGISARFGNGTTYAYIYNDSNDVYYGGDANAVNAYQINTAGNFARISTNNAERMRIDSAGNLQLSTASTGILASDGYTMLNQTPTVITIGATNRSLNFATSASANAMVLDTSGNLVIGTTSTSAKFEVSVAGTASYSSSSAPTANILLSTNGAANSRYTSIGIGSRGASGQSQTNYITNVPEATDGNAALAFSVYGGYAAVERARIDSSGNLLVGTTSLSQQTGKLEVWSSSTSTAGLFKTSAGATASWSCDFWNDASSGNNLFVEFATDTTYTARGSITYNRTGGLTVYNTTSDARLKQNIVDAPSALSKIASIQIRSFDWKETGNHVDFGVIAQELNEVAPEAVTEGEDSENSTIKRHWGVDTSVLVPALVKAVQEQQAIIESLKARLDAANL